MASRRTLLRMPLAFFVFVATVCLPATSYASASLLVDLFLRAQNNDSIWAAARANYDAGKEYEAIGRASLLPTLGASFERSKVNGLEEPRSTGVSSDYSYVSRSKSLTLRQPLFDLGRFATYKEGVTRSQLAETALASAAQELLLRVGEAYFNYRLAQDNLDLAQAQRAAITAQKEQATHLQKAGVATITDVAETQAKEQLAMADELSAKNQIGIRRKELERIVGPLPPAIDLQRELSFLPVTPDPVSIDPWLISARERNLSVLGQQLQLTIAEYQADQQRAAHYPNAALVGSYSAADRSSLNTNAQESYVVRLQVNVPLFEGGRTSALTRQSVALIEKARSDLETSRREAEVLATRSFLDVINGVARISAFEQASISSEVALRGMQAGQQAGFRTNSDVLLAQQQLFSAKRDLQRERYNYLLSRLRLKSAVGDLSQDEIRALNI